MSIRPSDRTQRSRWFVVPRRARLATIVVVAVAIAGCGGPAPSGTPTAGALVTPNAWLRVPEVEQPSGFMTVHTDASGNPYTRGCAPCHPAIDTLMTGVAAGPAGLVTVGWVLQDFKGASWKSTDGSKWSFTGDFPAETLLNAVVADSRGYVAVGRDGQGATAWTSTDGSHWEKASSEAFAGSPLRLTSLTNWHDGFVAGGFKGNEFFSADAAFWVSTDGRSWQRATDSADLHGARVSGVAAGGPGLVAVGQTGSAGAPGPAIVWTSVDGIGWTRVPDGPVFHDGRMRAIAAVPGVGLVAVGEDIAGDTGIIWLSQDGLAWSRAPSDEIFGRPGIQVRIYTVAAGPAGVVAAGTLNEGIQYGAAAVWTSKDGTTWKREPAGVEFLDTEMTGSTRWNDRIVAVGDRGAPDAYQATIWLSPAGIGR